MGMFRAVVPMTGGALRSGGGEGRLAKHFETYVIFADIVTKNEIFADEFTVRQRGGFHGFSSCRNIYFRCNDSENDSDQSYILNTGRPGGTGYATGRAGVMGLRGLRGVNCAGCPGNNPG